VATARALNPAIETVVRTHNEAEARLLDNEKAGKVFLDEQELAQSMTRHVLERAAATATSTATH
jgi:CPA2 family monovalent cation:H+ antiporter-2